MRTFRCDCGQKVYFENDRCLACGRALGFDLKRLALRPLAPNEAYCASHANPGTCNWLVGPAVDGSAGEGLCFACGLNDVVPDLTDAKRRALFHDVEKAKRRLLFGLFALGLPVEGRAARADGLAFRCLADERLEASTLDAAAGDHVLTGHAQGCITINLLEADPALREGMRLAMNEPYRTLLGHFRHESGHYYWHRLAGRNPASLRAVFGDERAPYQAAMDAYYQNGPPADWQERHIGAYAASHPWEDFAECWAHYLHIVDTLETAGDAAMGFDEQAVGDPLAADATFEDIMADWQRLAPALNDLNRSMGLPDAYPFHLPAPVLEKLRFVHDAIRAAGGAGAEGGAPCR